MTVSVYVLMFGFSMLLLSQVHASTPGKSCGCGKVFKEEVSLAPRVVGGSLMSEKDHPALALVLLDDVFICGGTVISNHYVLTAAHCVPDWYTHDRYTVKLGVHDRIREDSVNTKVYPVKRITRHEEYKELERHIPKNDIALFELDEIKFTEYIQPICLPSSIDTSRYKSAVVAGWGTSSDGGYATQFPMQAVLSLLTIEQCNNSPIYRVLEKIPKINDMILCAYRYKADACQGDSGGPLYIQDSSGTSYQLGIVSFGVKCMSEYPGLYTRITTYIPWIKKLWQ